MTTACSAHILGSWEWQCDLCI